MIVPATAFCMHSKLNLILFGHVIDAWGPWPRAIPHAIAADPRAVFQMAWELVGVRFHARKCIACSQVMYDASREGAVCPAFLY